MLSGPFQFVRASSKAEVVGCHARVAEHVVHACCFQKITRMEAKVHNHHSTPCTSRGLEALQEPTQHLPGSINADLLMLFWWIYVGFQVGGSW